MSIVRGLAAKTSAGARLSPAVAATLERLLEAERKITGNTSLPIEKRIDAIQSLGLDSFDNTKTALEPILSEKQSPRLQLAAIKTLGEFTTPEAAILIINVWSGLTPQQRTTAGEMLFSRQDWITKLLDAVDEGTIPLIDIEYARLKTLEGSKNKKLRHAPQNYWKSCKFIDAKMFLRNTSPL